MQSAYNTGGGGGGNERFLLVNGLESESLRFESARQLLMNRYR